MNTHQFCYKCKTATPTAGMIPYGEWNQDALRTINHLACPCGEREDIVDAWPCERCEDHFPKEKFETGTDLCIDCAAATIGVW